MLKKILNITTVTLLIVSAAIGIYTFVRCGQLDTVLDKEEIAGVIQPLFAWMYALVIVAIVALIVTPLPYMAKNPSSIKKFGIGLLAMGVLFLITSALSSDAPLPFLEDAARKNEYSHLADMNLISMYIMSALALLGVLLSVVVGALKPNK